jgi:hypothetical protein
LDEAYFFTQGSLAANANDMKTLILAMRLALRSKDFDYLRRHGGVAEDVLINIVKRNEGNELFLHYRKELIEIINITNQMNGCDIIINEDEERIAKFLLPPLPHGVKVQNSKLKMLQMKTNPFKGQSIKHSQQMEKLQEAVKGNQI